MSSAAYCSQSHRVCVSDLMRKAYEKGQTLYQVKHGMLSEYLCQQLKSPLLKIGNA